MHLTDRETALVLASLLLAQDGSEFESMDETFPEHFEDCPGKVSDKEIAALYSKIDGASPSSAG